MSDNTPTTPNRQMSLFEFVEDGVLSFDGIRACIIDGEPYISILDTYKIYGNSSNPDRDWARDKAELAEQGYKVPDLVLYGFPGKDGKVRRSTPVVNETQLARIAQVAKFPQWEPLRQRMADLLVKDNRERAARKREAQISTLEKAGYGDHPHTQFLKERHDGIENLKRLKAAINRICEQPRYGQIFNAEYQALFGAVADQLVVMLNTKSVRDGLSLVQLRALNYGESALQMLLAQYDTMTNAQILKAVDEIMRPIGASLRQICDTIGVHHVTGQRLIEG